MAGGQIWSAISGYQAATAEQQEQDRETRRLGQEAKNVEAVTAFKQTRAAQAGERQLSSMEAATAAGGAVSTQGAPLMALAKQNAENELRNLTIGWEGAEEAKGLRYEAAQSKWKARLMAIQKRNALYTGLMGAGGTALMGFSKMQGAPKPTGDISSYTTGPGGSLSFGSGFGGAGPFDLYPNAPGM